MGRHHARIAFSAESVDLVAVVDQDASRADSLASRFGCAAHAAIDELPQVDVAIVATPTPDHVGSSLALLERGCHLLVEKPLAGSEEEAATILEASRKAGRILAVGHVERYNAAALVLAQRVTSPLLMQFERLSPFTPRIDESVVFDLMVHDLDLACWMAGEEPIRIQASGSAARSDTLDVAVCVLEFPSGCVASLQASRLTQDKVRRICVTEEDRYLVADLVRQDVRFVRETTAEFEDSVDALYRQSSLVEVPYLDRRGEPLARQMDDFIAAITSGGEPTVTGEAGLLAVRLAEQVEQSAG